MTAGMSLSIRQKLLGGFGLVLGLPGTRRLMDEFEISSEVGTGTTVTLVKWRQRDELEQLRERRRGAAPRKG